MPEFKPFSEVDLFAAVGHWHQLILHLPIALFLTLALIELRTLLSKNKGADLGRSTVVLLLAISGPLAATTGWFLHETGEYGNVEWHERLGIATGFAALFVAIAFWKQSKAYRPLLVIALGLVSFAGHLGANITHGENYVLQPWLVEKGRAVRPADANEAAPVEVLEDDTDPAPLTPEAARAAAVADFDAQVLPIMDAYCTRCHGERKQKEGLRLDSYAAVLLGSEWGSVVNLGNAADSVLVQSLHLPLDDDGHMPPADKEQPTAAEIATIEAWINAHP